MAFNNNKEKMIGRRFDLIGRVYYFSNKKYIFENNQSVEIDRSHPKWNDTKFSAVMLIEKNKLPEKVLMENLKLINDEIIKRGYLTKEIPIGGTASIRHFVRDGDDPSQFKSYKDEYKGNYVLSLKFKNFPKDNLKTMNWEDITEDNFDYYVENGDFYNGVLVKFTPYAFYVSEGNLGLYASLASLNVIALAPPFYEKERITQENYALTPEELAYKEDFINRIEDLSDEAF